MTLDPYMIVTGAIVILTIVLVLALMLQSGSLSSPDQRKFGAHAQALVHLADVLRAGAYRAPDPESVRAKVDVILEFLEYPKRGKVSDWEEKLNNMIYTERDDDPSDAWDRALLELFEFAGVNLYCGFSKSHNVVAYERVRECLRSIGIEAKPVAETALGQL
jgi:hypothetical protein